MGKLSEEEVRSDDKVTWYYPHRFVINPKKPGHLRRVYYASANFRGQSLNKLPTDRALGVTWDAQEDVFRFNKATTKSSISKASSVWDPRGLLPFLIRSKIILQNLNRLKYGWDDELK